jgi:hypothetical protein
VSEIAEKRVFDDRAGETTLLLAARAGLVRVSVADDRVGRFGLVGREPTTDVAVTADGRVVVATPDAVRVDGEPTGHGGAVAVGTTDGAVLAADDAGRVSRTDGDGDGWRPLGTVGAVRAIDGALVAAADGVARATADGLVGVGLDDARGVAAAGRPLAATADGLYALGNGWLVEREGGVAAVAGAADGRALAVADDGTTLRRRAVGGDWAATEPTGLAAVAVGPTAEYGATAEGRLAVDAGAGWRHRALGVEGVRRVVVAVGAGGDAGHRSV